MTESDPQTELIFCRNLNIFLYLPFSKLGSYSSSSDDKHFQRFIPAPSARTINSGVLYRLINVPPLVAQCALDSVWQSASQGSAPPSSPSGSISDSTILRLALQVHRQLLTVDGADDELGNSTSNKAAPSSLGEQSGSSRPTVGPSGDAPQQKSTMPSGSSQRDGEKFSGKLEI